MRVQPGCVQLRGPTPGMRPSGVACTAVRDATPVVEQSGAGAEAGTACCSRCGWRAEARLCKRCQTDLRPVGVVLAHCCDAGQPEWLSLVSTALLPVHCFPRPKRRFVRQLSGAGIRPVKGHQIRLEVRGQGAAKEEGLFALCELASGACLQRRKQEAPLARSGSPARGAFATAKPRGCEGGQEAFVQRGRGTLGKARHEERGQHGGDSVP
eukprot:scaffold68200_cov63-Phaeocystis_antarctica.AAC.2